MHCRRQFVKSSNTMHFVTHVQIWSTTKDKKSLMQRLLLIRGQRKIITTMSASPLWTTSLITHRNSQQELQALQVPKCHGIVSSTWMMPLTWKHVTSHANVQVWIHMQAQEIISCGVCENVWIIWKGGWWLFLQANLVGNVCVPTAGILGQQTSLQ